MSPLGGERMKAVSDQPINPRPLHVLVVDDEPNVRRTLAICLETRGHVVAAVGNVGDAMIEAQKASFDLAFVDLRLGVETGMTLIPRLLAESPWLRIVVITAHGSVDAAVEAMRLGAADFIAKPFTPAQVEFVTDRVARQRNLEQRMQGLEERAGDADSGALLESNSAAMRRAVEMARQVASSEATVLLRGESGTGKGVLARAIHSWSGRANRPFSTVSAPTLSGQLLESELFGHVKGAFTGAVRDNPGRIANADGGTLFLDEIGDLPAELQPKLLRFLQDRQYERVGDTITRKADVRLITATNVDLELAVREKRFREDLFYRINVVQIDVPALRDRPEDVLPLAEGMLAFFGKGKRIVGFTEEAAGLLRQYSWPGNVRELKNVVERAVIFCKGDRIAVEHLPASITPRDWPPELGDLVPFEKIEEAHLRRVLANTKSLEEAARVLDIDTATLWRKRRRYGI